MVAWSSLSPAGKVARAKAAYKDGANTAGEIAEKVGTTKGAIIGLFKRENVKILQNKRAVLERAKRASERGRGNIAKANAKRRSAQVVPIKTIAAVEPDSPLPKSGEGVSLERAIDTGGCRYAIGEPSDGFDMEVCGKKLTPQDKEKNFHFCESCQPHLINVSAQTQARRAANG